MWRWSSLPHPQARAAIARAQELREMLQSARAEQERASVSSLPGLLFCFCRLPTTKPTLTNPSPSRASVPPPPRSPRTPLPRPAAPRPLLSRPVVPRTAPTPRGSRWRPRRPCCPDLLGSVDAWWLPHGLNAALASMSYSLVTQLWSPVREEVLSVASKTLLSGLGGVALWAWPFYRADTR